MQMWVCTRVCVTLGKDKEYNEKLMELFVHRFEYGQWTRPQPHSKQIGLITYAHKLATLWMVPNHRWPDRIVPICPPIRSPHCNGM